MSNYNIIKIRSNFPILSRRVQNKPIIYLDNAATTFKPISVINSVNNFYTKHTANIHRGDHLLSQESSNLYERTRTKVAEFINAHISEIVFTSSATEGINLVAASLNLKKDDEVICSELEHHSNILPWMNKATVKFVKTDKNLNINFEDFCKKVTDKTKIIALSSCSNVVGIQNDLKLFIQYAKRFNIPVLVDAAQTAGHISLDVKSLGCDFLVFSGHKMCAPSGVGVLYISKNAQEYILPQKLGGGTVDLVNKSRYSLKKFPTNFEAGTPNIEGVIGLGSAIDFIEEIGLDSIEKYLGKLTNHLINGIKDIPKIKIFTPIDSQQAKSGIVSFYVNSDIINNEILARNLNDSHNIMIRTGYHCAHVLHDEKNIPGTSRISLYLYNTIEEVETTIIALQKFSELF